MAGGDSLPVLGQTPHLRVGSSRTQEKAGEALLPQDSSFVCRHVLTAPVLTLRFSLCGPQHVLRAWGLRSESLGVTPLPVAEFSNWTEAQSLASESSGVFTPLFTVCVVFWRCAKTSPSVQDDNKCVRTPRAGSRKHSAAISGRKNTPCSP